MLPLVALAMVLSIWKFYSAASSTMYPYAHTVTHHFITSHASIRSDDYINRIRASLLDHVPITTVLYKFRVAEAHISDAT